jgi:hypothetical protein
MMRVTEVAAPSGEALVASPVHAGRPAQDEPAPPRHPHTSDGMWEQRSRADCTPRCALHSGPATDAKLLPSTSAQASSPHRATCDGTKQPHMQSRPGKVKSSTIRTSGTQLRRTSSIEAHHILSSNANAKTKLQHLRRDIPVLSGRSLPNKD